MQLSEVSAGQKLACPACGGEAQWNPAKRALVCAYCGTESPYELKADGEIVEHDLVAALQSIPQTARGWRDERRSVRCQHCQAISVFSSAQQGKACDFCGSTALVPFEDEADEIIRPESLLPFDIDQPRARDRVRQWYGSRFWAPNNLGSKALTDTLHGVYLPYWTFDADVSARYTAQGGEYYQDRDGKRQVRWFPVSGQVRHFFDDTLVCASRGVHPRLIQAVEPFPTTSERLKPYDPGYLSGWTVERYQLDLVGAAQRGRERMMAAIRRMCAQDIRADTHRNLQVSAQFERQTFKHVLLPVWLVGYRYGSRDYQVLVNGATGQVAGEYPKSWVKITIAVLLALVVLAAIIWLDQG
ncbi:MAG: zinc ribbon domain-containing protein [Hydrogenophaga sp.]|jgi:ribosomal protein S27E|uniref:zinc ribbon domain-containing protein n=1 Tax=Hydrogenophaga sp. TaxID=1904254 RepID=UPI002A370BFE|nr:zinc ribbon domain-containing protein [Hydrogenophaga sp.]MDX9969357.1 zinc ribbon domain-containing protein [Hydrogenophaga sp.]